MKTFYIQVPDDLGDAIMKDAKANDVPVADYILEGLSGGIGDGFPGEQCDDLLNDYLNRRHQK